MTFKKNVSPVIRIIDMRRIVQLEFFIILGLLTKSTPRLIIFYPPVMIRMTLRFLPPIVNFLSIEQNIFKLGTIQQ